MRLQADEKIAVATSAIVYHKIGATIGTSNSKNSGSKLAAFFQSKSKLIFATTLITIPSLIIIGFTWSIYEGRFGWWFLVSWIPLAAIGTQRKIDLLKID